MKATLAICSVDRRKSLLRTLDTVALQRCDAAWEVLVVDNGSGDGSAEAVEQRALDFPVPLRVRREERRGIAFARNRALADAQGEILVFADDDVDLEPGFLHAHLVPYADPRVSAVGGRIRPLLPPETPAWLRERTARSNGGMVGRFDYGDAPADIDEGGPIALPFGANVSLRRDAARAAGGFRTDLGWGDDTLPGEETDLLDRIRARGGRLVYAPRAIALHRFQPEKATLAYFERYERSCGRVQVLRTPPGVWTRLRWIAGAGLRWLEHSTRAAWARDDAERIECLRQRARAHGRLAQLLARGA